jgi:hypothetical protein
VLNISIFFFRTTGAGLGEMSIITIYTDTSLGLGPTTISVFSTDDPLGMFPKLIPATLAATRWVELLLTVTEARYKEGPQEENKITANAIRTNVFFIYGLHYSIIERQDLHASPQAGLTGRSSLSQYNTFTVKCYQ